MASNSTSALSSDPSMLGGPNLQTNAEFEALEKDPRSNKTSKLLKWIHGATWDPQAKNQRKGQSMPGSKAHLPWAYCVIPQIPKTLKEFQRFRTEIESSPTGKSTSGSGPESAVALYVTAMLVYTNVDKDIGKQCIVLASCQSSLVSAPGSLNGYGLPHTSFFSRLDAHPNIARCLMMFTNAKNRYDPTRDGKKMILKIRDCSVRETTGDSALRSVWKSVSQLPAGFKLKQRNGTWKVASVNPICYPPDPPEIEDDVEEETALGPDPTLLKTPGVGISNPNPKHEKAALEKDPRSNKNSTLLSWVHHAVFDPQSRDQPKKQPMKGSKAHLPWAYVHIPALPNTVADFVQLREKLGQGPEAATALYAVAMLVYTMNENVGLQCMVVASDRTALKSAPGGGPHTYKGFELDLKSNRLRTMFFDRLKKHPTIAWCLLFRATRENRYDPRTEGFKLFFKIRDCHVSESKGDICKRAIWKFYAKLPAGMRLHRNTRGVWKVAECNPICYPPAPPPLPAGEKSKSEVPRDDGDDI